MVIVLAISVLCATGSASAEDAPVLDIRPDEAAATCGVQPLQVEVTVRHTTQQGILAVELYGDDPSTFLKRAGLLHRIRVPAEDDQQTVCFDAPSPGRYAVVTYHDVDADRRFDRRFLLPAEPFGLSNNPPLKLRMPRFEDSAFEVGEQGTVISIDLNNAD
jgi:uncharacterized protein (DUF2141 family)|nr:MAG: DUF2141 domain-containing protein [Hyphomicrobiales bacterium]